MQGVCNYCQTVFSMDGPLPDGFNKDHISCSKSVMNIVPVYGFYLGHSKCESGFWSEEFSEMKRAGGIFSLLLSIINAVFGYLVITYSS